jgi:hypothetical protein
VPLPAPGQHALDAQLKRLRITSTAQKKKISGGHVYTYFCSPILCRLLLDRSYVYGISCAFVYVRTVLYVCMSVVLYEPVLASQIRLPPLGICAYGTCFCKI